MSKEQRGKHLDKEDLKAMLRSKSNFLKHGGEEQSSALLTICTSVAEGINCGTLKFAIEISAIRNLEC